MVKKEKVKEELVFKCLKTNNVHEALWYIQANLKCPKNQKNNFGNYSYRNCEDILKSLKPLLKETQCYIKFEDQVLTVMDRVYIRATALLHHIPSNKNLESSAQARESECKKGMDASQITGAASSYARKYALNGMFAIDDNKDADFFDNKESTDTPNKTWKPKGLPPKPLVESKIPEPNVEMMEQENPPVFDFNKK
jgi:hypothetical protein